MKKYTDNTILKIGKHKGNKLIDIPDDWLLWFWKQHEEWYKYAKVPKIECYSLRKFMLCQYIEESFMEVDLF
jgi:uncharacterized protein (DUF3820 family)